MRLFIGAALATLFTAFEFDTSTLSSWDAVAFGCPAMEAEVLEERMRTWEETCLSDGAVLACESVICNEAPDDDVISSCKALGAATAQ